MSNTNYDSENDYVREPDKPRTERLVDNGVPYFSIDDQLEIFRELHNSEGEERKKIKKFIKDNKLDINKYNYKEIDEPIEYNSEENNNLYVNDNDFDKFLKQNEEQYLEEQYMADQIAIIDKLENEELIKKNKLIENKKIKLEKLILRITNILKFSINNDESIVLYILNDYIENSNEYILLSEQEFIIFKNYLKKNYKDPHSLNRRTFLDSDEHDFLDTVIKQE